MIERDAAKVYTRNMYLKFQMEIHNSAAYSIEEIEKGVKYSVHRLMDHDNLEFYRKTFTIEVDQTINSFNCICKKYNRDGLLCCHVLRLFTHLGIYKIPENYIKVRWTKSYLEEELKKQKLKSLEQIGRTGDEGTLRHAMMLNSLSEMCSKICWESQKCDEFVRQVELVFQKVEEEQVSTGQSTLAIYKDPAVVEAVSVDKGHRLVRTAEKSSMKKIQEEKKAAKKANSKSKKEEATKLPAKKKTKAKPKKCTEADKLQNNVDSVVIS